MISFCFRDICSFYTPNCQRPRFDRAHRRVNTLGYPQNHVFFIPQSFCLHRLAVSVSIFASSLGALLGASYSTFCNVSFFIVVEFLCILTIIFRWQKARIPIHNALSFFGFFWCSFFTHYTPAIVVAVCTSDWSITRFVCRGGGHWRHLQTRRKRASHGHILCSMLSYFYCRT